MLGEDPIALTSENLNVASNLNERTQLNGDTSISVPLPASGRPSGPWSTSVAIDATDATDASYVVGVSLIQYNNNAQRGHSNSTSVSVQLGGYPGAPTGRRRLAASGSNSFSVEVVLLNKEVMVYDHVAPTDLTVRCVSPRDVEYTEVRTCPAGVQVAVPCPPRRKGLHRVTCPGYTMEPVCTTFDGVEFVDDPRCVMVSFDAFSTTCNCNVSAPASVSNDADTERRALQQLASSSSVQRYGSQAQLKTFGFTTKFDYLPELDEDPHLDAVLWTTLSVCIVAVLVTLGLKMWLRTINNKMKLLVRDSQAGVLPQGRTVRQFFDSLLPDVFQQPEASWRALLPSSLLQHHTLGSVWWSIIARARSMKDRGSSFKHQRNPIVTWLLAVGKTITFIFANTLVAYFAYRYDGECIAMTSQSKCESSMPTLYHRSCSWSSRHESCYFQAPAASVFNVIVLGCIALTATVVYNRLLEWLVVASLRLVSQLPAVPAVPAARHGGDDKHKIPQSRQGILVSRSKPSTVKQARVTWAGVWRQASSTLSPPPLPRPDTFFFVLSRPR